jgi:hypothetical protein
MLMISNIKRFELSESLGWVKLTRRGDGEESLLYPEDALNLAAWVAENREALVEACLRLEAEAELARHSVGAPDLPTRQEIRQADPTVEFVMAPKPEQRQPKPWPPGARRRRKRL